MGRRWKTGDKASPWAGDPIAALLLAGILIAAALGAAVVYGMLAG